MGNSLPVEGATGDGKTLQTRGSAKKSLSTKIMKRLYILAPGQRVNRDDVRKRELGLNWRRGKKGRPLRTFKTLTGPKNKAYKSRRSARRRTGFGIRTRWGNHGQLTLQGRTAKARAERKGNVKICKTVMATLKGIQQKEDQGMELRTRCL